MTIANEEIFTQSMLDRGVKLEVIQDLRREFRGWRLYFRVKGCQYEDIISDYKSMLKAGYTETSTLKELASVYELSRERIKVIIKKYLDKP